MVRDALEGAPSWLWWLTVPATKAICRIRGHVPMPGHRGPVDDFCYHCEETIPHAYDELRDQDNLRRFYQE